MAASDVDICNIALAMLEEQRITSLTESTEQGRYCNVHYDDARDFVLRLHPWNFATRRAALARNATAPGFGYGNSFKLPTDPYCLRVISVNDPATPPDWKVEGRDLLSDEGAVNLVYIGRIIDVTQYDAGFVQTLAHYLAWKLAKPLTGSKSEAEQKARDFDNIMRRARNVDGAEDVQDGLPTSPFVLEHLS
ncbi:MAG: hypothetical protein O2967_17740 [Proteobacteria bacterium]|nr:hypothetical protein [Pseudomonadota bacterium]